MVLVLHPLIPRLYTLEFWAKDMVWSWPGYEFGKPQIPLLAPGLELMPSVRESPYATILVGEAWPVERVRLLTVRLGIVTLDGSDKVTVPVALDTVIWFAVPRRDVTPVLVKVPVEGLYERPVPAEKSFWMVEVDTVREPFTF